LYRYANLWDISVSNLYNNKDKIEIIQTLTEKKLTEPLIKNAYGIVLVDCVNYVGLYSMWKYRNDLDCLKIDLLQGLNLLLQKLKTFLSSSLFLTTLNQICTEKHQPLLTKAHQASIVYRYYIKKFIDLKKHGSQIKYSEFKLPVRDHQLILESNIKYTAKDEKKQFYNVYCDVDPLILMGLTEVLVKHKLKPTNIRYIVLGSADKDYVKICEYAQRLGILIIVVSVTDHGLSRYLVRMADMIVVLHPQVKIMNKQQLLVKKE
jgi:hypothetical protein